MTDRQSPRGMAAGAIGSVSGRRATADVVIQVVAQVTNVALGVVVTALIARQLGVTVYGQWATIFAVIGITGFFADLNLQDVAVRRLAAEPEHEAEWLGAMVGLKAVLSIPVLAVSIGVLLIISRGHAMRIASVILALTLLVQAPVATQVAFSLRVRNDLTMAVLTLNSVVWGVAVVAITTLGGGMTPLAVAFTLVTLLSAAVTFALARRRTEFRLRGFRTRWKVLVRIGLGVGLASLLSLVHGTVDQLLVYELAPHRADAGLYGGLFRILTRATVVPVAVVTTLYPMLAATVVADRARARRLVQAALEYLAMVSLPALAFSLVSSKPLLRLVLGPQYVSASKMLPVVMGAYVAICWGYVATKLVIVLGLQRRFIIYVTAGLALNIGLNLLFIPRYGYEAAAWITVLTEVTVIALTIHVVSRELELRLHAWRLARLVGLAAVLAGALAGLKAIGLGFALLVLVTLTLYPALLVSTRALDLTELRSLVTGSSSS